MIEKLLDPQALLEQVEAYLRGEILVKDKDGNMKRLKKGKPLLNEKGIQEILKIMRMRLGEIYRISNLDMVFIREETYLFNLNIASILASKAESFDLDRAFYQELVDYLTSSFECIVRMSLNANTIKILVGIPTEEKKVKPWMFG